MLNLHSFCETLGFGTAEENFLAPHWETLCAHTTDDMPEFMQRAFYAKYSAICQFSKDILSRMNAVAEITAKNPECRRYANILEYGFFKAVSMINFGAMPEPVKVFGENSGIFQLMVVLASLPLIEKTHAAMGIPEKYSAAAAQWIPGTVAIYAAAHNEIPGHTLSQTHWMRHSIDGKLFRIGRLEFLIGHWSDYYPAVYINRKDRSLTVLCSDQICYDKDGYLFETPNETAAFTARLKILDNHVTGTPIMPNGFPRTGRKITLDLNEWEPLFAQWDLIPGMHIPGGGGMTPEILKESMLEAKQFFHKYFATDVKAFNCGSWIFNPAWEKELPDSNLAAFQRNVYMTSVTKHPDAGLFFVYGRGKGDARKWQCTTSLHKAFCRIADRGESLAFGRMFILASDIEKFGTEYYRKKYQF